MPKRSRFCIRCGREETPTSQLRDNLCPKCTFSEEASVHICATPTVSFCKVCRSLKERGTWLIPSSKGFKEDLSNVLRRMMGKLVAKNGGTVLEVNIQKMPDAAVPGEVLIPITVKVRGSNQDQAYPLKEFSSKVKFTPTTCHNCILIKRNYYEAILQIRGPDERMTKDQKANLFNQLSKMIDRISRSRKQTYVLRHEDKPGGFDLYFGSRQIASRLASHLKTKNGALVKETFKSGKLDRSSGIRKSKVTILIRLPRSRIGEIS